MRKRMLDPNIWTNRHFLRMNNVQKLLYISLISHSDDHGRLWNDVVSFKSYTFPAQKIPYRQLEEAIALFGEMKLISYDDVSIQLLGWKQYQYVPKPQQSQIPEPDRYRTSTEPLPNQYGSDTEPIPSKERKKQRKKERKDYYPSGEKDKEQIQKKNNLNGNEFEADTIMQDVFNLFEENKFKLSHSQYNEVNSLIEGKKHLSAQTKLFEYLNLTVP